MSKWLDNFSAGNKKRIQARIDKLNKEINEYKHNYNDFPYERYLKAIERREAELEELKTFADPERAKAEVEDYKDAVKTLKEQLAKVNYVACHIDASDKVSDANVRKLVTMTSIYAGDVYLDEAFKAAVEKGVW